MRQLNPHSARAVRKDPEGNRALFHKGLVARVMRLALAACKVSDVQEFSGLVCALLATLEEAGVSP